MALLAAVLWPRKREPVYKGKKLSEWLYVYNAVSKGSTIFTPEALEGQAAIRQIGTNAVPFLLDWIKSETPGWKVFLYRTYTNVPAGLQSAKVVALLDGGKEAKRGAEGLLGLSVEGPAARAAIPALRRMANGAAGRSGWYRSVVALSAMGDEGELVVIDLLRNPAIRDRRWLIQSVGRGERVDFRQTDTLSKVIIECLEDEKAEIRALAARKLGIMKLNSMVLLAGAMTEESTSAAVRALRVKLSDTVPSVRSAAAWSLGTFGMAAAPALPELKRALTDANVSVSDAAKDSMLRIAPEALGKPSGEFEKSREGSSH